MDYPQADYGFIDKNGKGHTIPTTILSPQSMEHVNCVKRKRELEVAKERFKTQIAHICYEGILYGDKSAENLSRLDKANSQFNHLCTLLDDLIMVLSSNNS